MPLAIRRMVASLFSPGEQKAPLPVRGAMLSDVGCVRAENEDCVRFQLPSADAPGLALVADGMGGHAAGEVASGIAAAKVMDVFFATGGDVPGRLRAALDAANAAIRAHVAAVPETQGMGTTCTALAFADGGVFLGHVGDSRAYVLREGALRQISEDHSLVGMMVRAGQMSAEEAAASPQKNVILAALGLTERVEAQVSDRALAARDGDRFLLCSDGLSDMLDDAEIASFLAEGEDPENICAALVAAAKARGGADNISVGVFMLGAAPEAARAAVTRQVPVRDGAV